MIDEQSTFLGKFFDILKTPAYVSSQGTPEECIHVTT